MKGTERKPKWLGLRSTGKKWKKKMLMSGRKRPGHEGPCKPHLIAVFKSARRN